MNIKKITTVSAGASLAAGWLAVSPPANADNDTYLQYLISHGVVTESGQFTSANLVQTGNNECAALREGKSETFLIGQLYTQMGRAQAQDIVYAAHHYLCPGA